MHSRTNKVIDLKSCRGGTIGEGSMKELTPDTPDTREENIVRTTSATVLERPSVAVSVEQPETVAEVAPVKKIRIRECGDLRRWWDEEETDRDSCECA